MSLATATVATLLHGGSTEDEAGGTRAVRARAATAGAAPIGADLAMLEINIAGCDN